MADDDLFARLNALKAPTGAPNTLKTASQPHPSIKPSSTDDDITARFRRLASGDSNPVPTKPPSKHHPSAQSKLEDVVANLPSERVENVEDEQSLDDLLRELGEDQSSWLNNVSEEDRVSSLLQEAKAALPQRTEEHERKQSAVPVDSETLEPHVERLGAESEQQARSQEEQDEKDADDYIAQVMADIEIRKKHGDYRDQDGSESSGDEIRESEPKPESPSQPLHARSAREATPLDSLPSAPSTAPVLASISDDDLETRFASLSLPTTPSNKPLSRKLASAGSKPKSNVPAYTDKDIESWCVICNEDAAVRCLGCEGDLYCQECWAEGHRGPDAGYDEKQHKAVLYSRGEGKEKRKKSLAAA